MAKKKSHEWTIADERYLIDELISKYQSVDNGVLLTQIAEHIGTSKGSVVAKIANHKHTLGFSDKMNHTSTLGDQAIREAVEKYQFSKTKWETILS